MSRREAVLPGVRYRVVLLTCPDSPFWYHADTVGGFSPRWSLDPKQAVLWPTRRGAEQCIERLRLAQHGTVTVEEVQHGR